MNKFVSGIAVMFFVLISSSAMAVDSIVEFSIADAMALEQSQDALNDSGVKFYFGDQKHPKVVTKQAANVTTTKKTSKFGKSQEFACQWAFLSAMIALRDRALRDGANAVINIRSNHNNKATSSTETFKCNAGKMMVNVALKADVVTIK